VRVRATTSAGASPHSVHSARSTAPERRHDRKPL
jgi:hypothetical protein